MPNTIPFVTMKWSRPGEKAEHKRFTSQHVNAVLAMLRKTQKRPFKLYCVTDDFSGLDPAIEPIAIPPAGRDIIDNHGGCWVQLYLFSREFREAMGAKFIYSDLDVAIVGDMGEVYDQSPDLTITAGRLAPLFLAAEEVYPPPLPRTFSFEMFWGLLQKKSTSKALHYRNVAHQRWCRFNGSFMIIDKDQPDDLWEGLSPPAARTQTRAAHILGSNQAWLQLAKQGEIKTVGKQDGFWFKRDIEDYYAFHRKLPADVRLIVFAGEKSNPWNPLMQQQRWVRDVYPSP